MVLVTVKAPKLQVHQLGVMLATVTSSLSGQLNTATLSILFARMAATFSNPKVPLYLNLEIEHREGKRAEDVIEVDRTVDHYAGKTCQAFLDKKLDHFGDSLASSKAR